MELEIPLVAESFYKTTDIPVIKNTMAKIAQTYFAEIQQAETLTRVSSAIINAVIFTESKGNKTIVSSAGAIGLMQLKPQSANDSIFLANKQKRLSEQEKQVLRKTLGNRLDAIFKQAYCSHKIKENNFKGNVVTASDLQNPAFNILCGAILLGLLIDQHNENGKLRLDKVLIRYNRGYFYKPKGNTPTETLTQVKGNKEAYNYVLKVLGKNGLLEMQA